MYRIAAVLAVLMLFAACHDDGVGMEWGAGLDPSVSGQSSMEELTVEWLGTDTAIRKEKKVTIDAGRGITVEIAVIGTDDEIIDSCSGSAEMTEVDYQTVVTKVNAADLPNYEPPVEGDEDCVVTEGLRGMAIAYSFTGPDAEASEDEEETEAVDGVEITKNAEDVEDVVENTEDAEDEAGMFEVMFETGKCAMESNIEDMVSIVGNFADTYITDCSDETIFDGGDDDSDTDTVTDTDGDCIPDSVESAGGTDPSKIDTDGDGLPDGWVASSGLGEDLNCNGAVDVDADGRSIETDPTKDDSDGDRQNDYVEMTCGGTFNLSNLAAALDATQQCEPEAAE